tara:strand:- start:1664 stop:2281 length:618 start_codon:yes stop_codon:yes gene_type:complete
MAIKDVARGFDRPPGMTVADPSLGAMGESLPIEPETDDGLVEPTPQEERQIDMFLGSIKDFIWDEGYDAIVERMREGQANLNETIGETAGRMVNREVKASDGGGNPVSRDLLFSLTGFVVNDLFELAKHEGIYKGDSDQAAQQDQGEALIHAVIKYGKMGDPSINPQDIQSLAANAVRGGYPEEKTMAKMGIPTEMEPPPDMEMV